MEVKIGVTHAHRELVLDVDLDADAIEEQVRKAIDAGGILALTDTIRQWLSAFRDLDRRFSGMDNF